MHKAHTEAVGASLKNAMRDWCHLTAGCRAEFKIIFFHFDCNKFSRGARKSIEH